MNEVVRHWIRKVKQNQKTGKEIGKLMLMQGELT